MVPSVAGQTRGSASLHLEHLPNYRVRRGAGPAQGGYRHGNGARCSPPLVRAFARSAMGRRIDRSSGRTHLAISHSRQDNTCHVLRYTSRLFMVTWHQIYGKGPLHDWCNKGRGMCYSVCGMVHVKEPLLLIGKSSPCRGGSGFPFSRSEWSFTICLMPYNCKIKCVECIVK